MPPYTEEFLLLLSAYMAGAVSPGPDAIMVIRNSTCYGRMVGLATSLGLSVSAGFHCLYILLGLDIVFDLFPVLHDVVLYVGASYLFYLGVRAFFAKRSPKTAIETGQARGMLTFGRAFRMGFFTNLFNPFAILHLISLLGVMVSDSTPPLVRIVFAILLGGSYMGWNSFLSLVLTHPFLQERFFRMSYWIQKASGIFLIYIAITFVFGRS